MAALADFFHAPLYEHALASYAKIAQKRKWDITHKLDMYNWAKVAFDSSQSPIEKRLAFQHVYDNLKSGWRVFRNARAGYWSAGETFDALTQHCAVCSRQSGIRLVILRPNSQESEQVLACLATLQGLKPAAEYPWMPVAKFTHFFNPMLFPIYDGEIMWTKVLNGVFRTDYRQWCERHHLNPSGPAARFNLHYMLWAGDSIRSADSDFMAFFSQWFKVQVTGHPDDQHVLDDTHLYSATAFEFVAIGAAHLDNRA